MTTLWDKAVRTLYPVLGDRKDDGPELVSTIAEQGGGVHYYCGGPDRRCDHLTCRTVSALAEADHLTMAATEDLPPVPASCTPDTPCPGRVW